MYKIFDPIETGEFEEYLRLRWLLLRRPLGGKRGSEIDALEEKSFHAALKDGNNFFFGVGRIHFINNESQIRYMAIKKQYSRFGYGSRLIKYLEDISNKHGIQKIFLNSRVNAVTFYEKNGYTLIKKVKPSFGKIIHYRMEKVLDNK